MHSNKIVKIRRAILVSFFCTYLQSANGNDLANIRAEHLATLLPDTPKGYGPTCADRAAWSAPVVKNRITSLINAADKLIDQDFPPWDRTAYLEYSQQGTRIKGEAMMNARKSWLFPLVIAECATWEGKYLPAIERTLHELNSQPVWNWPAHDGNLRNFIQKDYEVDLVAADLAHDIAQTLYMLGNKLNPQIQKSSLDVLENRIFRPVRNTINAGNRDNAWLTGMNNWNAVCLKGVVSAALAVLPSKHDRSFFIAVGEKYIANYVAGFTYDGYTTEGPTYWNYGFSHFTELRETLYAATRGEIDLFTSDKVHAMALYGYNFEMTPSNVAAFGDALLSNVMDDFTRAYSNETFGLNQPQKLKNLRVDALQTGNSAPIANTVIKLFAAPSMPAKKIPTPLRIGLHSYYDSVGVLVSRPDTAGSLAITIKSGGNSSNSRHSHNDIGSYSIALDDEKPTGDPGGMHYTKRTFSNERYSIREISSWGHPVPLVAGELQLDATKVSPKVIDVNLSSAEDYMLIDLRPAYQAQALIKLTRSMRHKRVGLATIEIEDKFTFTTPQKFETAIIAIGKWRYLDKNKIELWQNKKHLMATIESSAPIKTSDEKVIGDGITFSRISIYFADEQQKGFIRVKFSPML
jgi:hypothetical protein